MDHDSLALVRIGIDTWRSPVAFMRADCEICRSEGFAALTRVEVHLRDRSITATLQVVTGELLGKGDIGLSDDAWRRLGAREGDRATVRHPLPLEAFGHVRAKMYGQRLDDAAFEAIVRDIADGRWPDIHVASFLTACADDHLDLGEMVSLTRAMVGIGERLTWDRPLVVDKHCVGGLPGNRTTPIVVAIAAAHGLLIPKTSSRAITSPAGTADVVDTFTRSSLTLSEMRRVVEREGGCLAWGGAMSLSPVDDALIRIEHPLDIDSEGQLVASILSKKIAAGSTHVVIDIPVGATAKVRTAEAAAALGRDLTEVGRALGLAVRVMVTDGSQPVGRGIGPALEGKDVLAVLRRDPAAPVDLRTRALEVAGAVLELDATVPPGLGRRRAEALLDDGSAWRKLVGIAEAQGGLTEPPTAAFREPVTAPRAGRVVTVDNRRLSRSAKLAGAPISPAAGVWLHKRVGDLVEAGEVLFEVHADAPGELAYALEYVRAHPDILAVEEA